MVSYLLTSILLVTNIMQAKLVKARDSREILVPGNWNSICVTKVARVRISSCPIDRGFWGGGGGWGTFDA
jgi:hypothetical protein